MVSRSPMLTEKPSLMQSRYMPTSASATPAHTFAGGRLPRSMPSSGTSKIYSAVKKPDLPTLVYTMPYCCKVEAASSATPQAVPPISSCLRAATSCVPQTEGASPRILSSSGTSAASTALATKKRTPFSVSGPTWASPADCATKPNPQISAVNTSSDALRTDVIFFKAIPLFLHNGSILSCCCIKIHKKRNTPPFI